MNWFEDKVGHEQGNSKSYGSNRDKTTKLYPIQSAQVTALFRIGKEVMESADYSWLHIFPFPVVRPVL